MFTQKVLKNNKEIPKINKPVYKDPEWKFIFKRSIVFYTPKTTNSWKILFFYIQDGFKICKVEWNNNKGGGNYYPEKYKILLG